MTVLLKRAAAILSVCALCLVPDIARGQARNGKLIVTVIDQTTGVLAGAVVTLIGLEDVTKRTAVAPANDTDKGIATFENLVLGRYSIEAEFPGFDKAVIRDVRVRAGDNRQTLTLALSKMSDTTTVGL